MRRRSAPESATAAAAQPRTPSISAAPGGPAAGELMDMFQATEGRWGSRDVEITDVAFVGRDLAPSFVFHSGDPMSIRLKVRAHQPVDRFRVRRRPVQRRRRVLLRHEHLRGGDGARTPRRRRRGRRSTSRPSISWKAPTRSTSPSTNATAYPYDYHRLLYTFRVKSRTRDVGIYRPRHRWTFSPGVQFKGTGGTVESGRRKPRA